MRTRPARTNPAKRQSPNTKAGFTLPGGLCRHRRMFGDRCSLASKPEVKLSGNGSVVGAHVLQPAETPTDIRVYMDGLRRSAMSNHSSAPSVAQAYSPQVRSQGTQEPARLNLSALRPNHRRGADDGTCPSLFILMAELGLGQGL
jgi:hypothetical protein